MKSLREWLADNWQSILLWVVSVGTLLFVCFYHLSSITDTKLSPAEVQAIEQSRSARQILDNPLSMPHKLGQYAVIKAGQSSTYALRAVTAVFSCLLVLLFYALARHWFSPRIAWMSTLMLATSTLFLGYGRLATPDILLPLALLGLLGSAWWVNGTRRIHITLLVVTSTIAAILYVPGMVWFIALAVLAQKRHISRAFKKTPVLSLIVFILLGGILIAPLARSFVLNPVLIRDWLALPAQITPMETLREFLFVPLSLVVRALPNPEHNLGRLPYLDIFTICVAVLGMYSYLIRFNLVRTKTIIGAALISWLLIAFSNTVSIVLILPLIYLTVAGGIMLLLQQWFTVFPKNPIARRIGMVLLLSVISISIFYNFTRYFVAWANSPVTRETFSQTLPPDLLQ